MRIVENLDLEKYNSYKLKATCVKAFFPSTEKDLLSIYQQESNAKKIILGNGNNVILSKEYYTEEFIIFNGNFNNIKIKGDIVEAEAGATLEQLSLSALKHGLTGLEIFYDIPGSVGGSVVMNAGASGIEIKDILIKVRYIDLANMSIKEMFNNEIGFGYRNGFFQKNPNNIILKAWFKLAQGNQEQIHNKMQEVKKYRWAKQPRDFPNCGSVFKRPERYFVGQLIENLDLKGYSIGGAKISEKHGGFIINFNNATGADILNLIEMVKSRIKNKNGIILEMEQRIL